MNKKEMTLTKTIILLQIPLYFSKILHHTTPHLALFNWASSPELPRPYETDSHGAEVLHRYSPWVPLPDSEPSLWSVQAWAKLCSSTRRGHRGLRSRPLWDRLGRPIRRSDPQEHLRLFSSGSFCLILFFFS